MLKRISAPIIFSLSSLCSIAQAPDHRECFHPDSLRSIINLLADDSLKGRFTTSPGAQQAAQFIAAQFRQAGLTGIDGGQEFTRSFTYKYYYGQTPEAVNVIGYLPGTDLKEELVIFSAHYDHIGTRETNPLENIFKPGSNDPRDTIYNGANDNASGTTALITLAKYYAASGNRKRSILFIAFDAEELGIKGSSAYAQTIQAINVKALINLEMLGRGYRPGKRNPFLTGAEYSNLAPMLNKRMSGDGIPKSLKFIRDPYKDQQLFRRSDNYPFALLGIPAHTIMLTSPHDKFYHSVDDEGSTLDFEGMSLIIRGIARACEGLLSGEDTPKRIKPGAIK